MYSCIVIGLSDDPRQSLAPEAIDAISHATVFSGGRRHHDLVAHLLPDDCVWIEISSPLSDVFRCYDDYDDIVIFASGDPFFYGFASTIQRERPDCRLTVFPTFNSLQLLAHRLAIPYQDLCAVSLTGRPWCRFDEALISGQPLIGVLTDRVKSPHTIVARMSEFGYDNYDVFVGERLGNDDAERVGLYDCGREYASPNCLILRRVRQRHRFFGIPDEQFHLLDGRSKMITKMPIRLAALSALDLRQRVSFWDVGFCTGSVSIEAKLQFPHLQVSSFEIRPEGQKLMSLNSRKFGAPGIGCVIGDFLQADLSLLPAPDAVFVGGHGGRLADVLSRVRSALQPGGVVVFNSVQDESRALFLATAKSLGMNCAEFCSLVVDGGNLIHILRAWI